MKSANKTTNKQRKCIEPVVGERIYDYYNGALSDEEVISFERHLIECRYCQKVVMDLDHIFIALIDSQNRDPATKSGKRPKKIRCPPPPKHHIK
jgi:hypothetical protein